MGQQGSKHSTTAPFPQGHPNGPPNRGGPQYGAPAPYGGPGPQYRVNNFGDINNVGDHGPFGDFERMGERFIAAPPQMSRRQEQMDDGFWEDDDPVYLPEPRRRRFDPFEEDQIQPRPSGVRQRGLAGDIIDNMRRNPRSQTIEAGRVNQYRAPPRPQCMSPQQCAPPQPRITKYTSYVDEPRGYRPPGPSGNVQFGNPAPPQYTMPQAQVQSQGQPGQTIMYYDPQTGAITGQAGGQQQQGFQMPQGAMYGQPQQPQQQYAMPQQAQPIVIPGSLYTGSGQIQRLG